MKEKLKEWKKEFYEDSAKLSDLVRNLGLAGIGLIWIFNKTKTVDAVSFHLPPDLICPLILIVSGLLADILQYVWRSITIYGYYMVKREKFNAGDMTETEISKATLPPYIGWGSWIFFGLKIVLIGWAYALILSFLISPQP